MMRGNQFPPPQQQQQQQQQLQQQPRMTGPGVGAMPPPKKKGPPPPKFRWTIFILKQPILANNNKFLILVWFLFSRTM